MASKTGKFLVHVWGLQGNPKELGLLQSGIDVFLRNFFFSFSSFASLAFALPLAFPHPPSLFLWKFWFLCFFGAMVLAFCFMLMACSLGRTVQPLSHHLGFCIQSYCLVVLFACDFIHKIPASHIQQVFSVALVTTLIGEGRGEFGTY